MPNAKTIAIMQEQASIQAARRSGKSGMRLLDDGENNVGNSTIIEPVFLPLPQLYSNVPVGPRPRLLNLTAESKTGQSVTVVMTASRLPNSEGGTGPITGIIEFGNGTQTTFIEFDLPIGPFMGGASAVSPGSTPQDSGAVVQVPSSIVRAFARYDNAFITPIQNFGDPVFGQPGTLYAIAPASGPFAPNPTTNDPSGPFPGRLIAPVNIKAFANYFGRHFSRLYKTQYLYVGDTLAPVVFQGVLGPQTFAVTYAIPPFAKSVRLVREPQSAAMTITLFDGCANPNASPLAVNPPNFADSYAIAASAPCPPITIDGTYQTVGVKSASNNDTVSAVKLIYEIGF